MKKFFYLGVLGMLVMLLGIAILGNDVYAHHDDDDDDDAGAADVLACYKWDIFPYSPLRLNIKYHSDLYVENEQKSTGNPDQVAYAVSGKGVGPCSPVDSTMSALDGTVVVACKDNKNCAEVQRFHKPKADGIALDWCLTYGKDCGQPAADYFCKTKGYEKSVGFKILEDVGYTKILKTGEICKADYCDSFKYVKCTTKEHKGAHMGVIVHTSRANDSCRSYTLDCTSDENKADPTTWTCFSRNEFDVFHGPSTLTKVDATKDATCGIFQNGSFDNDGNLTSTDEVTGPAPGDNKK